MYNKQRHYQVLAKECIKGAEATLGAGWHHVSKDIRWGLVCAGIVALHSAQDEENSSDNVRAMINEVTELCRAEIYG
jgi:hypothetical protein